MIRYQVTCVFKGDLRWSTIANGCIYIYSKKTQPYRLFERAAFYDPIVNVPSLSNSASVTEHLSPANAPNDIFM